MLRLVILSESSPVLLPVMDIQEKVGRKKCFSFLWDLMIDPAFIFTS